MEYKGKLNNLRVSPRKVKLIADMVKSMPVEKALAILEFTNKAGARGVYKLVRSVESNFKYLNSVKKADLIIKHIFVTPAPVLKRGKAVSRGRFHRILRRSSNINISLEQRS